MLILATYWVAHRHMRLSRRGLVALPVALLLAMLLNTLSSTWTPAPGAAVTQQVLAMLLSGSLAALLYGVTVVGLRLLPLQIIQSLLPSRLRND